jgi:hypothetical protein
MNLATCTYTTPIPCIPFPQGRGSKLREASDRKAFSLKASPPLELTLGAYSRGAKPLSQTSPLLTGEGLGVRSWIAKERLFSCSDGLFRMYSY